MYTVIHYFWKPQLLGIDYLCKLTHTHTHRDFSPPQFHKYPKDTIDPPAAAEVEESDAVTKAVTA